MGKEYGHKALAEPLSLRSSLTDKKATSSKARSKAHTACWTHSQSLLHELNWTAVWEQGQLPTTKLDRIASPVKHSRRYEHVAV